MKLWNSARRYNNIPKNSEDGLQYQNSPQKIREKTKEKTMKKIIPAFILFLLICVGCTGKKIDDPSTDLNTKPQADPVKDGTYIVVPEDDTNDQKNKDNTNNEANEETFDYFELLNPADHFGEVYYFAGMDDEYTDLIDSDSNKREMTVDLDNDGINEAIVCVYQNINSVCSEFGVLYVDENVYVLFPLEGLYFICEDKSVRELEISSGQYLIESQYLLTKDNMSYLTLNGYLGTDSIGRIITVVDDEPVMLTKDLNDAGHKFFSAEDEVMWVSYDYNAYVVPSFGEPVKDGSFYGLCKFPYIYKIENTELKLIGAKEMSLEEVNALASFDDSVYDEGAKLQFIYRENGELFVNIAVSEIPAPGMDPEIRFECDMYHLSNGKWIYYGKTNGFINEDPMKMNEWDLFYKKFGN